mgnify:FL=1
MDNNSQCKVSEVGALLCEYYTRNGGACLGCPMIYVKSTVKTNSKPCGTRRSVYWSSKQAPPTH